MKILVVNCGSSSIKYKLFDVSQRQVMASGMAERIGTPGSIDTTMGLTPLTELVMGTRSGDVAPSVLLFPANHENMSAEALDELFKKKWAPGAVRGQ